MTLTDLDSAKHRERRHLNLPYFDPCPALLQNIQH